MGIRGEAVLFFVALSNTGTNRPTPSIETNKVFRWAGIVSITFAGFEIYAFAGAFLVACAWQSVPADA